MKTNMLAVLPLLFQHAAARRRLMMTNVALTGADNVSTRSRPKAAELTKIPMS